MTERAEHTAGPWFVKDFRAVEMKRLGWTGPSIDRILITNDRDPRDEDGCIVARIQFDNRTEQLDDGNLADARLIAAAPDLLAACQEFVRKVECGEAKSTRSYEQMKAAISRATGEA